MYRGRGGGGSWNCRRSGGGLLLTLAFHALAQYAGSERKPPVTAALIIVNVLLFLRPGRLDDILPTVAHVCLNPHTILKDWDLKRLFLSAFYHLDETHLVYNMLSLLWKGVQLEGRMGSLKFAEMVAVLLGLSHGLVVVLAKGLNTFFDYPDALYSHCAIGFSGVLFALKVVLNWNSPNFTDVYGVLVPARYAAWAELVLIQMFVPGTSFLGHLCGIIAGLLYVHNSSWLTASGLFNSLPHQLIIIWNRFMNFRRRFIWWLPFHRRGRTLGRENQRGRNNSPIEGARPVWRCQVCTYDNPIYEAACEMCGASYLPQDRTTLPSAPPMNEMRDVHLASSSSSSSSSSPSVSEMRRARLARFSR